MAASTYAGIESDLDIGSEVAVLSVSLFVAGLGVGPLLLGPLSEFLGRNKVSILPLALTRQEGDQAVTSGCEKKETHTKLTRLCVHTGLLWVVHLLHPVQPAGRLCAACGRGDDLPVPHGVRWVSLPVCRWRVGRW
jgi:MFS family permease